MLHKSLYLSITLALFTLAPVQNIYIYFLKLCN